MDYDFDEFELLPFSVFHHTSHNKGGELFICKF